MRCANCPVAGQCLEDAGLCKRLALSAAWIDPIVHHSGGTVADGYQYQGFPYVVPDKPIAQNATGETIDPDTFITSARLASDTQRLISHLPPGIGAVVGIARSGLVPAGLVAYGLHIPLWSVSTQTGVVSCGHGYRMHASKREGDKILLIDDTVARGNAMRSAEPVVRQFFPDAEIVRAAVYVHPLGSHSVDLFAASLSGEHYLEWNWVNAGHGQQCYFDFDGILCHDCPPGDDDDGPRYRQFLTNTKPLYIPRRAKIAGIVTARHCKYEPETRAWLDRWGISVDRLIMRESPIDPGRSWVDQIADHKAAAYRQSSVDLFAESEPEQARLIADRTGKPVLCPAAGRVFRPTIAIKDHAGPADAADLVKLARRNEAARRCKFREPCGCNSAKCGKIGRRVTYDECGKCPDLPS